MNYIEFHPRKKIWTQAVKAIHLPDVRSFEFVLQEQANIEDILLGSIGNGISDELAIDELKLDLIYSVKLVRAVVYLDTTKECKNTLMTINAWGTDKTAKFVFDEFGRLIDLEASLEDTKIVLRGDM